ncbi:predicted protein [Chaetomium globosum CBS 148.51]|uniref:Uncharacterized protein n=1 Tax=Chaetomium globosum (strain ATCC 6205 / CBS 148.51 / DSM 1962 / NBRC 6347 / NRRL 1970) TaxID=306901 RepID=Q2GYN6_CHAGB|nr:uncharacterized protein CHGG_06918 [Chaetomium globosum CBS 148.51]EAQ85665.1 predicted protein [Chaetomium globosum CBS 148.51]
MAAQTRQELNNSKRQLCKGSALALHGKASSVSEATAPWRPRVAFWLAPAEPGIAVPAIKGPSGPSVKTLKKKKQAAAGYPEAGWILLAGLAAVQVAAEHAVRVVRCLSALVEAWKARWCNVAFELGWALVD